MTVGTAASHCRATDVSLNFFEVLDNIISSDGLSQSFSWVDNDGADRWRRRVPDFRQFPVSARNYFARRRLFSIELALLQQQLASPVPCQPPHGYYSPASVGSASWDDGAGGVEASCSTTQEPRYGGVSFVRVLHCLLRASSAPYGAFDGFEKGWLRAETASLAPVPMPGDCTRYRCSTSVPVRPRWDIPTPAAAPLGACEDVAAIVDLVSYKCMRFVGRQFRAAD